MAGPKLPLEQSSLSKIVSHYMSSCSGERISISVVGAGWALRCGPRSRSWVGVGRRRAVVRGCIPGLELVSAALWSAVAFLGWLAPRCGPRSRSWVGRRRAVVRGRIPGLVGAALWSAVAFLGWCWSRPAAKGEPSTPQHTDTPSLVLEAIDSSALAVVRQHEAHNGRQVRTLSENNKKTQPSALPATGTVE